VMEDAPHSLSSDEQMREYTDLLLKFFS
jgi:hypothetical protein